MKKQLLQRIRPSLGAVFERLYHRLARWFTSGQVAVLSPEDYHGPTPEEVLAQDGLTRLLILACLDSVAWADLTFISVVTRGYEEIRERSLAWLLDQGCVTECQQELPRNFFWERRRQIVVKYPTAKAEGFYDPVESLAASQPERMLRAALWSRSITKPQ